MAAPADIHVIDTNSKTFQAGTTLESRVNQNDDKTAEIITALPEADLKVGFTISNLISLLPPERSVDNFSESVIGWIFIFPQYSEKRENSHLVTDITIEALLIQEGTNGQIEVVKQPLGATISPKIIGAKRGIPPIAPITYNSAYDQIKPFILDDPLLHISRLNGYESWAELAFISRTDLDLMRIMLTDQVSPYNDFLISGAKSDYLELFNPEFLMRSENFTGKFTAQKVTPTTNLAFTLKCEPIIAKNNKMARGTSGPIGTGMVGDGASSLPVIASMVPCPEIWNYESALEKTLKSEEVGLDTETRKAVRQIITSSDASTPGKFRKAIPGSSYPSSPCPPDQPDFFDWLRDFFHAFINLFTGSKKNYT